MLAWMHDKSVTEKLHADFASKTMDDAENFIKSSWDNKNDLHLAIASDSDEYMGTVSLKHIEDGSAEFAITVRAESMGKGYSWFGMESILRKAFDELGLESVYWCVSRDNARAVRFYDKHGFHDERSREMVAVDAGICTQNICLACAAFGLSTVPRASMKHAEIQRLLSLSEYQVPIMNNPIGYPAKK